VANNQQAKLMALSHPVLAASDVHQHDLHRSWNSGAHLASVLYLLSAQVLSRRRVEMALWTYLLTVTLMWWPITPWLWLWVSAAAQAGGVAKKIHWLTLRRQS